MKLTGLIFCLVLLVAGTSLVGAASISDIQHGTATGSQTITGVVNLVYPPYDGSSDYVRYQYMDFFLADDSGAYNGIAVYQSTYGPRIGDNVTLTGTVAEYNGKTQIQDITSYVVNSTGNVPYAPVVVSTDDFSLEQYEGCLVQLDNVYVSNQHTSSGRWEVQTIGGGTVVTLDDELDYNYFPKNNDQFDSLIGIVERDTSASPNQWLQPRFTADLAADPDIIPHYALFGTVVTMDDGRNVYDSYYIEVLGDLIETVSSARPAGVDVIEVDGLIFPALINSHDHPSKDLWDIIPLPYISSSVYPDIFGTYTCLNDWAGGGAEPATKQMYNDFRYQAEGELTGSLSDAYAIAKLAEVRMASSGCAVTQGQCQSLAHYNDNSNKLGVGIINCERFPARIYNSVFPKTDKAGWTAHAADAAAGKMDRYILHLCQSWPTGCEADEWNWWMTQPSYDGRTTIIHGNSLDAADFAEFTEVDGNKTALSWACLCNILYYGQTCDIPAALAAGVCVSIGCDATPWGNPNMLAELNYCKYFSDQSGWSIQSLEFADMVTRNGAVVCGRLDDMGTIEEGKIANFMVIEDGEGDPYDDLLMVAGAGASYDYRCGPKDVRLTVVAGRPLYGDSDLFNTTNFPFINPSYLEDLTICGTPKKLSIARYNSMGVQGAGDLFSTFYTEWWNKYYLSGQYPCTFMPVDPAGITPVPPITPPPTPTPPPGTYIILDRFDDAVDHNSYYDDTSDYLYVGDRGGSSGVYTTGFRFQNCDLPRGATINAATLYLTRHGSTYNNAVEVTLYGEKVSNSAAFASGAGPKTRAATTAFSTWTFPAQAADTTVTCPDLSAVVEEIVGQGGWSSGNALTLLIQGNDGSVDRRSRVYSYDGDEAKSAMLVIDYVAFSPTPTPEGYKTPSPSPTVPPTATPSPTPYGYKSPPPTATPDYVNLLPNPSFEDWSSSTSPDDWTPYTYVDVTQETSIVHGGTSSLRLELSTTAGSYGRGLYADATTEVGKTYTFQMWVYSDEPGSMGITGNWYDGTTIYWNTVTSTTSGEWELLSVSSTAPAGTSNARCWVRGFKDNAFCGYADDGACYEGSIAPTPIPPSPTPVHPGETVVGDYNGDGTTDLAIFRPSLALWKIRNLTSIYFGASGDQPVPQDYDGDGTWDLAYFRPSSNLWKIKDLTRIYFGTSSDAQVPGDYDGDGTVEPAYFRPSTTLWNVRNQTRIYFGTSSDEPLNGDFNGDGTDDPTFFRSSNGLWKVRNLTSVYFGTSEDILVPADYNGDGTDDFAWYRPSSTLWKVKDLTRIYYATSGDTVFAGDFDGDGSADYGYFRPASILWKIKDVTRVYFGQSADTQVSNPY